MAVSVGAISETQVGTGIQSDNNGAYFQPSRGGLDRTTVAGINLGTCTIAGSVITANGASRTAISADLGNYVCFTGSIQRYEVISVAGGTYTLDSAPGVTGVNGVLGGPGATYNLIVSLGTGKHNHYLRCARTVVSGLAKGATANNHITGLSAAVVDDYLYIYPDGNATPGRYRAIQTAGNILLSKNLGLTGTTAITNTCMLVKAAIVSQQYPATGTGAIFPIPGGENHLVGYYTARDVVEMAISPLKIQGVTTNWTVSVYSLNVNDQMTGILLDRQLGTAFNGWGFYGSGAAKSCHFMNFSDGYNQGASDSCLYETELLLGARSGSCSTHRRTNCIMINSNGFQECYGISNCIAVECGVGFSTNSFELPNCVAYNCVTGFVAGGPRKLHDCIALNCTTGYNISNNCHYYGDEHLAHFGCTTPFTGTIRGTSPLMALSTSPLVDPANADFRPKPGADGDVLKYLTSFPQYNSATPIVYEKWIGAIGRAGVGSLPGNGDRRNGGVLI